MKVRVTLMTENDAPVSSLVENPEEAIRNGWKLFLGLSIATSDYADKSHVEKVEILE